VINMPDDDPDATLATVETQVALLLRRADSANRRSPALEGTLERSAYLVLRRLASLGPASISALADELRLDASTMTRQVLAMQAAGHVERGVDPTDARRAVVSVTDEGRAALVATRRARLGLYDEVLADWSAADRTLLAALLARLNASLDEHAGRRE
jgi:DNA-binding MarR family transcriptional regulator